MTINRFLIDATASDKKKLEQLQSHITTLIRKNFGDKAILSNSIEEELGIGTKEIVLTIVLSITTNFATDGLKKAIDLLPLVRTGECSVDITQIDQANDQEDNGIVEKQSMPVYHKYLNQIVAGTHIDEQGEKMTKQIFEKLISSSAPKMPLHQHHDMGRKTLGYLENFKLVPDKKHKAEWNVIADVYITSDNIDEALNGFSFSMLETVGGNTEAPLFYIHLPYPVYNDIEFIESLIREDDDLLVGKWVKKALDPIMIALITTGIALFFAPEWDIQYKKRIRPAMERLLKFVPIISEKKVSVDLIQHVVGHLEEKVKVYFVPDRSDIIGSYKEEYILSALKDVEEFLNSDIKAKVTGIEMVKLYFDKMKSKYLLFHVQYLDGADSHIA